MDGAVAADEVVAGGVVAGAMARAGGRTSSGGGGGRHRVPAATMLESLIGTATALAEAAADCARWPSAERTAALSGLDRLAGILTTARGRMLIAEEQAGTSLAPGDRDFTAARARTTRTGYGQAAREVAQATTLETMPTVADAVSDGRVPLAHLDALARIASRASAAGAAVLTTRAGQDHVVDLAERLPVRDFTAHIAQLVASQDPADGERDLAAQRAARFLHLSHQPDGTYLRGRLDRVSGEILRVALDSTGQAPDETRDKAQADADALVAVARRATGGSSGAGSTGSTATRPHLSLIVPAATFAELRAHHARADRADGDHGPHRQPGLDLSEHPDAGHPDSGHPDSGHPDSEHADAGVGGTGLLGPHPVEPATLEDGTPVAMSELARALCDCDIARIVLTADAIPVDLGRTQRLYPAAHRRAVILRDRHCAWDGCAVPASYCDVHHIRWWDRDNGPTSLDNAVLLCSHHHHVVHTLDLRIERLPRPPGTPPTTAVRAAPPPSAPPDVRDAQRSAAPPDVPGDVRQDPVRYRFFRRRDGRPVQAVRPEPARGPGPRRAPEARRTARRSSPT
ncbi:HNH endonuclease signature motif containing protein [Cellulomonas hominis]